MGRLRDAKSSGSGSQSLPVIYPLQEALQSGAHGQLARAKLKEKCQAYALDLASKLCDDGGASLDWIDIDGLVRKLNTDPMAKMDSSKTLALSSTTGQQKGDSLSLASTLASQPLKEKNTGLESESRRWPSIETFEEFYHVPDHARPRTEVPPMQLLPLKPVRPTISSFDDLGSLSGTAYFWAALSGPGSPPSMASMKSAQDRKERAGIFEAAAIYRQACKVFKIRPLSPMPVFGDSVELTDSGNEATRQCYALAEALRACGPSKLAISNSFMTDVGVAKLIRAVLPSGRLQRLRLTGLLLGHRSCVELYACLRSRGGHSLQELQVSSCGVGDDLDETLELDPVAASAYADGSSYLKDSMSARSSILWHGCELDESSVDEPQCLQGTPVALPVLAQIARPTCPLRHLDISMSSLSYSTAQCLKYVLITTPLEVLKLDYCSLSDKSVDELAEGLSENRLLLDLSLRGNCLSGGSSSGICLLRAVRQHARIVHLDISENKLPLEACEFLKAIFQWSLSLLSIHLLGQGPQASGPFCSDIHTSCLAWVLDHGSPQDATRYELIEELILCRTLHIEGLKKWHVVSPVSKQFSFLEPRGASGAEEPILQSWMPAGCWLCLRCQTIEYKWLQPDSGPASDLAASDGRVFVRPSFANFACIELRRQRAAGNGQVQYAAPILVPAGSEHYHFYEGKVGNMRAHLPAKREVPLTFAQARLEESDLDVLESIFQRYGLKNRVLNLLPALLDENYSIPEDCEPVKEAPPDVDPWAEDASRQQHWQQCFQEDLRLMHVGDLCQPQEEAEVIGALKGLYRYYYEAYAIVAGRSQWPLVRQKDVFAFFADIRLLDITTSGALPAAAPPNVRAAFSEADIHSFLLRAATKSSVGALTRPQFIEVLLIAASALGGRCAPAAHKHFAEEILRGRLFQPPLSSYPRALLQASEVSEMLASHRLTLRVAWQRYGSCPAAFHRLVIQQLRLCDRDFHVHQVASIYAVVRQPEPDFNLEMQGLKYGEFCEALGRLALVWRRGSASGLASPSATRSPWPAGRPNKGRPVRLKPFMAHLDAFLLSLKERMKPFAP